MWTPHSVESIWQDVAYAIRSLRHQRGFTVTEEQTQADQTIKVVVRKWS